MLTVSSNAQGLVVASDPGQLVTYSRTAAGHAVAVDSWQGGKLRTWGGWNQQPDGQFYVKNFLTLERVDFWRVGAKLTLTDPATSVIAGTTIGLPVDAWGGYCKPLGFAMPASFWSADITTAPVDPASAAVVAFLANNPGGYGSTWAFNCHGSGTSIACPPTGTPRTDWGFYDATKRPGGLPASFAAVLRGLPSPDWLRPAGYRNASSTDHQLSIIDVETGWLTELWLAGNNQAGISGWSACWGGAVPIATSDGRFPNGLGASASRCTITAGAMGIRETLAAVAAGTGLNHMLNMCSASVSNLFRWPSQFADGNDTTSLIREGMIFRLPMSVDVEAIPHLTKIARVMLRTIQQHGLIVTDQGAQCGISAEDPGMIVAAGMADPWATIEASIATDYLVFANVPWGLLELVDASWRP